MLLALVSTGCASNLASMQTGRTLAPGDVRVDVGTGYYVPGGAAVTVVGAALDAADRGRKAAAGGEDLAWTESDEDALISAAVSLAVMPPSPQTHAEVRVGVLEGFEAGLRLSTSDARLDVKYRLYHSSSAPEPDDARLFDDSTDVALQLGVSKHFFSGKLFDVLEFVKLDDFSRWDVELAAPMSHEFNRWVGLYGGPRYVFSHTTFDETLVRVTRAVEDERGAPVGLPGAVDMHFIGGTVGLRLGHPRVSLLLELTGGTTVARARVAGKERKLGGLTLYPAVGLAATF